MRVAGSSSRWVAHERSGVLEQALRRLRPCRQRPDCDTAVQILGTLRALRVQARFPVGVALLNDWPPGRDAAVTLAVLVKEDPPMGVFDRLKLGACLGWAISVARLQGRGGLGVIWTCDVLVVVLVRSTPLPMEGTLR